MNKKRFTLKGFFFSFIWLAVILYGIDLATKLPIGLNYSEGETVATLIPGFLRIQLVFNKNAAFGLGTNNALLNRILYIIIAFIITGIVITIYVLKYKKFNALVKSCLMLIVAGALGNLTDRLFFKFSNYCVVDWIDFYGIWKWHFNIADSCIVVGGIMLIVYLIVDEIKTNLKNKDKEKVIEGKVLSNEEKSRLIDNSDDEISEDDGNNN